MPTIELKRIGNAYIANQAQCASCRGCAVPQRAIVFPFDPVSGATGVASEGSLSITFSSSNQLKTLYYSWILPLLGFVAACLLGSLLGLSDPVCALLAMLSFVAGLFFCRTQGVECLTMNSRERRVSPGILTPGAAATVTSKNDQL